MRVLHLAIATCLIALGALGAFVLAESSDGPEGRRLALEISDATARPTQSLESFDTVQFTVFDFNGDGVKEILAKNDNNWVYVFDARTGGILFETRDSVYEGWKYRELSGAAVGDVNGNGRHDIVSTSSAGFITVWEMDPTKSGPDKFHFDELWSIHVKPEMADPDFYEKNPWVGENQSIGFDGAPYLADVDDDGADEIFVQADNLAGQFAFNGKGELMWGKTFDDGNANPWVADLDGNGKLEVVFATDAGRIWVYDAKTGSYGWKFEAKDHGATPGSISLAPGLIDINGDGELEVLFGTRVAIEDKNDPEWYLKQHTMVFALSAHGELLWNRTFEWGEPHVYMFPAAHDVDGDGVDDAIFMDWNTVGHKPGNWESTGDPNLFALNGKGEVLFQTKVSTYWSNKNVVVADFDGDGEQDIAVNKGGVMDGIAFFDLEGNQKDLIELPMSASRAPLVTDLYGDGRMHMLVPVSQSRDEPNYREVDVGYRSGRILVYDMAVPFDASWDNVFLFNLKYDHLYGGEAATESRDPVRVEVDPVEADAGLAVRVEAEADVERVEVRAVGGDGEAREMTRDADDASVWRTDLDAAQYAVTVHLEGGAFATRTLEPARPGGPAPGDGGDGSSPDELEPTPPGGGDGGTPDLKANDDDTQAQKLPAPSAAWVLGVALLGAAALSWRRAARP